MRLPDLALLRDVRPDQLYGSGFAARAFGKTRVTIQAWCRAGELASVRQPVSGHLLIPGRAIIELAADMMIAAAAPVESETEAEWRARADRAAEECRRLTRGGGTARATR